MYACAMVRLPAVHPVGKLPENGSGYELAIRVGRNQFSDDRRGGPEVLRVKRQQRQNDGKAEDIYRHNQKNG